MAAQRAIGQGPLSRADIAVYVGGLVVGLTLTHLVIGVFGDDRMTVFGGLMLAGVGLFMAAFMYIRRAAMMQRRYAYYFLHVIAFLMVNASFLVHAIVAGSADSWQGAMIAMPLAWSVGLFVHTLGTISAAGYEHVEV